MDPELGLNIVDLGLIYNVDINADGRITIPMTLTTPGCPLHASFAEEIERVLWQSIPDITPTVYGSRFTGHGRKGSET
ncbi:MAG TPA: metal-sulfur cluster assembly factor [Chloroflexota bacterium]|nr:metal-sulfur cluster assembly factor [Chloroflexota bacterium]HUM71889.1 metal-sulfur cluster assembly factor [Chloroflexota bacterium]